MPKLVWDETGKRFYENGVSYGTLYPLGADGYEAGVAWNGLTAANITPEGGEPTDLWADNIQYGSLMSAEKVNATIEAYTYPDEFDKCNGAYEIAPGVLASQQERTRFGFVHRTEIGNDVSSNVGYKLHILYGCLASPSEQSHATINDSPEAATMSWSVSTQPVPVPGMKPSAYLCIDSRKVDKDNLAKLEDALFGGEGADAKPTLLMPEAIMTLLKGSAVVNETEPEA